MTRPSARSSLTALRAPGVSLLDVVLPLLINELADLARPVVLVLDDYQVVEDQECHRSVAFLIEHLPKHRAARHVDPLQPAASPGTAPGTRPAARATGADLRFTGEETAALLNDRLPSSSSTRPIWPSCTIAPKAGPPGLHLAALTLKGHPDPHLRVKTFSGSHRHVIDYLGAELLDAQPPTAPTLPAPHLDP